GTNPFDAAERRTIIDLAAGAGATIALVLPAGLHPEEAAELAAAFAWPRASPRPPPFPDAPHDRRCSRDLPSDANRAGPCDRLRQGRRRQDLVRDHARPRAEPARPAGAAVRRRSRPR